MLELWISNDRISLNAYEASTMSSLIMFCHSHKKWKDSLETRAKAAFFLYNLSSNIIRTHSTSAWNINKNVRGPNNSLN